jgi:hypothetical protein
VCAHACFGIGGHVVQQSGQLDHAQIDSVTFFAQSSRQRQRRPPHSIDVQLRRHR